MKQASPPKTDVPPYYLQMARHWRMGSQSSDNIRRRLIQRGLSIEQTFKIIELLDSEDRESSGWGGGYRNRLWVPMRSGGLVMGFAPGTPNPQARTWLIGYTGFVVLGGVSLILNHLLVTPLMRCDLVGYGFIAIGLMGLLMYALNLLLGRFL